jgi:hypothetical protein
MGKYQVWIGGTDCFDCMAQSKTDALQQAHDWYCGWTGAKRLPNSTGVCQIGYDYYDRLRKASADIPIWAS